MKRSGGALPNKNALNTRAPSSVYYAQINPIDPVTPSQNWATNPNRRGFNMDDLSTYIIREPDKLQAALFDRFILKDDTSIVHPSAHNEQAGLLRKAEHRRRNQARIERERQDKETAQETLAKHLLEKTGEPGQGLYFRHESIQ